MQSYLLLFLFVLLLLACSYSQTDPTTPAWTFVQAGHCVAGGSTPSCTINLDYNLTPGNLYVFLAYLHSKGTNNVITSVSANGALVVEPGCQGRSQLNIAPTCAYILPSTSGGALSPITVTFSEITASNSKSWVYMAEFQPNVIGDFGLDNSGSFYQPAATTLVGPPFTHSASSDVTCETLVSAAGNYAQIHINAVSSPYNARAYLPGGFLGFSCAASSVVPTWTASSATAAIAMGFSIGLNPASPSWEQTFIDFEGGGDGVPPTEATLRASTHGWQGGSWHTSHITTMVYATAASHPIQNSTGRLLGDGNDYGADTGSLGIKITGAAPTAQSDYITYRWSYSNLTDMTIGAWYYTDLPATAGSDNDCLAIHGFVAESRLRSTENRVNTVAKAATSPRNDPSSSERFPFSFESETILRRAPVEGIFEWNVRNKIVLARNRIIRGRPFWSRLSSLA